MSQEKDATVIPCLVPDLPSAAELQPWLARIDANRWYTNFGPLARQFEARLGQSLGGGHGLPHVVSTSSGTAALELAIAALDLQPEAKVLLPAFTFPATAMAVMRAGLAPVLTDVDPRSWALKPEAARAILRHTRCDLIMPVAAFGCAQPADDWDRLAQETGVPVLIDAAAAFGSQAVGRHASVAFSFHATKPFGIGEGGLLASADAALIERCRRLSNFGFEDGVVRAAGCNAKLSEYHAAVGLAQFERWGGICRRRADVWRSYLAGLAPLAQELDLQAGKEAPPPAVLAVALRRHGAERIAAQLRQDGIEVRRWYLPPLHHHPLFAAMPRINEAGDSELPTCEALAGSALGIPFHTRLSAEQVGHVCASLAGALASATA